MSHLIFNLFIESILCFSNATNTNFIFCHSNLFIKLLFKYEKKKQNVWKFTQPNFFLLNRILGTIYIQILITNTSSIFFLHSFDSYFARLCLFVIYCYDNFYNRKYFILNFTQKWQKRHITFFNYTIKIWIYHTISKTGRVISRF